jgi:hypothetical protein
LFAVHAILTLDINTCIAINIITHKRCIVNASFMSNNGRTINNKVLNRLMRLAGYIALLWAGVLLGSSFLATPAKFLAPSLSMQDALEVGKVTFSVLSWVEYGLLLSLLLSLWPLKGKLITIVLFSGILLLFASQQTYLLPLLDARTNQVLQGQSPGSSNLHIIYIFVELLKVFTLIAFSTTTHKTNQTPV